MSKIEIKIRQRIIQKITIAGAISKKDAISVVEADLDAEEQHWLPYLVGGFNQYKIEKTEDNRYYHHNINSVTD
jgi:hypothetical protein